MAQKQNKSSLARLIVPLLVGLVGMMVVLSLMDSPEPPEVSQDTEQGQADPAAQPQTPPDQKDEDTASSGDSEPSDAEEASNNGSPAEADAATADADSQGADAPEFDNLRPAFADKVAALDEPDDLLTLGSFTPGNASDPGYEIAARINPYRASIYDLTIVNRYKKVDGEEQYKLLGPISFDRFNRDNEKVTNYPEAGSYAASYLTINGQPVKLWSNDKETGDWSGHWTVESATPGAITLSLTIVAGPADDTTKIAKVTRTYQLAKADAAASHTIELIQQVTNLTGKPMTITWEQMAQGDIQHKADYLRGRNRQYVTGYFRDSYDKSRFAIYVDNGFIARPTLVSELKDRNTQESWEPTRRWQTLWPNPKADDADNTLAWLASENRYFVLINSANIPTGADVTNDLLPLQDVYPTIATSIYPDANADREIDDDKRLVLIDLKSAELTLDAGKTTEAKQLSLNLFAGPREDAIFAQPPYQAMQLEKTIRYSLGGPCGICTFQWLANLLLGFLELIHAILFDWGIAIIVLVLTVRIILHPITKRGQINMMKMGKVAAKVQPQIAKLKKKYPDDPSLLQRETMKLYQENGMNPLSGALGCLPMFLQMPIWIALYAMLYYAIELRHEPAFYGVFQMFGDWPFLADLSSADRFIPILADDGNNAINLPFILFDYSSINILPILMGVTFFINMKFTTPPPMNEQQATQQKIMRIIPFIFPFFLYSAPAGLTLYIFASNLAGIADGYIVRKHVKQLEESGELFKPKERKPGGFMDKMQKIAEAKQAQMEAAKQQQQQQNRGPQQYKKRKR